MLAMPLVTAPAVPLSQPSFGAGSGDGREGLPESRQASHESKTQPLEGEANGTVCSRSGRNLRGGLPASEVWLRGGRARSVGAVGGPSVGSVGRDAQESRVDERVQRSLTLQLVDAVEPLRLNARQPLTLHFQEFRPNP